MASPARHGAGASSCVNLHISAISYAWAHWVISILLAGCFQDVLWNTMAGGRVECRAARCEKYVISHTIDWRFTFTPLEKASRERFSRRCEVQCRKCLNRGALLACTWIHACLFMCTWRLVSALIGWAFFSLPLFYPQVRAWLPIPWAAVLLNLQHMIHNSSPVKLNHSLLWPLINIQWKTQSLSWCASRLICSALSCL